jgi:hypothetical protein
MAAPRPQVSHPLLWKEIRVNDQKVDRFLGSIAIAFSDSTIIVSKHFCVSSRIVRNGSLTPILQEGRIQVADSGWESPFVNPVAHPCRLLVGPALEVMSRREETSEVPLGWFR